MISYYIMCYKLIATKGKDVRSRRELPAVLREDPKSDSTSIVTATGKRSDTRMQDWTRICHLRLVPAKDEMILF